MTCIEKEWDIYFEFMLDQIHVKKVCVKAKFDVF